MVRVRVRAGVRVMCKDTLGLCKVREKEKDMVRVRVMQRQGYAKTG